MLKHIYVRVSCLLLFLLFLHVSNMFVDTQGRMSGQSYHFLVLAFSANTLVGRLCSMLLVRVRCTCTINNQLHRLCQKLFRVLLLVCFSGIFGILWYVAWLLLGFSSPRTHPRISDVEKYYIVSSMKATDQEQVIHTLSYKLQALKGAASSPAYSHCEQVSTPWIAILTSPAVYGLTITHFCKSWGGYTLLSTMPTFFEEVLQLSSKHVSADVLSIKQTN